MRWKKDDTCLSEASCVISFPPLAVARELRGTIPASPGTPDRTLTAYSRQHPKSALSPPKRRTATGPKHLRLPPISSALSRYHLLSKLRQPSLHLLHHLCILLKLRSLLIDLRLRRLAHKLLIRKHSVYTRKLLRKTLLFLLQALRLICL